MRFHFRFIVGQILGRSPQMAHHTKPFDRSVGRQLIGLLPSPSALRRLFRLGALHIALTPGGREIDHSRTRGGTGRQRDGLSVRGLEIDRRETVKAPALLRVAPRHHPHVSFVGVAAGKQTSSHVRFDGKADIRPGNPKITCSCTRLLY